MSPLSSSMQNVAALTGGNAGSTGSSPLRRVPPALPALPGRPVAGRAARSTLDVVDEKSKSSPREAPRDVWETKPTETSERKSSTVDVNGSHNGGGSGVARLIAEANRRAMGAGAPAEASVQSTPSTILALSPKLPTMTRPVPALPVRSNTPVNGNEAKNSASTAGAVVAKSHDIPTPIPRQPPRKGSLNATVRKTPITPEVRDMPTRNGIRSMSTDSVGQARRMPPPLDTSTIKTGTNSYGENDGDHTVDMNEPGGGKKKARPAVPPKPVHL